MINFKCNKDDVDTAVFSGRIIDIAEELMLEIAMIYSGIESNSKEEAKAFERVLHGMFKNKDLHESVFGGLKKVKNFGLMVEVERDEDEDDDEESDDAKDEEDIADRLNNVLEDLFKLDPDELSKALDRAMDKVKRKKAGK